MTARFRKLSQPKMTDLFTSKEKEIVVTTNHETGTQEDCSLTTEQTGDSTISSTVVNTSKQADISNTDRAVNFTAAPLDLSPINSSTRSAACMPAKNFLFPISISKDGKRRRSLLNWFEKFNWIEYSIWRDAAFCFACRMFGGSQKEPTFTVTGFWNWKKALEKNSGFCKHETSSVHVQSMLSWKEQQDREEKGLTISESSELSIETLKPLESLDLILPPEAEVKLAKAYIARKRKEHDEEREKQKDKAFKSRFNLLHELYVRRDAFPEVYRFMAIVDTFGCSTSICECTFSALDRVGSPRRSHMGNERLRQLTFLAFEYKRVAQIPLDDVLKRFNANPLRRVQLF